MILKLLTLYVTFGLGFWFGAAVVKIDSFKKATAASVLRELLIGVLGWPIAAVGLILYCVESVEYIESEEE